VETHGRHSGNRVARTQNDKRRLSMKELKANAERKDTPLFNRLLSVKEVAAYLGISPRSIYNCTGPRARKPFPVKPKRVGKLLRFDIEDLERYIASL